MLKIKDWIQSKKPQARIVKKEENVIISVERITDSRCMSVSGKAGGMVGHKNYELNQFAYIASFNNDLMYMTYDLYHAENNTPIRRINCQINDFTREKIEWE